MDTQPGPRILPGSLAAGPLWARAALLALAAAALALLALSLRQPARVGASSTYGLVKTYPNPSPTPDDEFGNAVAWMSSGDQLAVAARSDELSGTTRVGAVYVINKTSGSVARVLSREGSAASDYFGYSLAVSGTQVLVGAPHDNAGANHAGAAYLFDATTGAVVMTATDPVAVDNDNFGSSVSILSSTAVLIGEPHYAVPITIPVQNVGRAYVCLIADGTCPTPIDIPDRANHDGATFGLSVLALGDRFAVGAPLDGNFGRVYVYSTSSDALYTTITPISATLGASFGWSLASVNGNILVGAQSDSPNAVANAGGAYLYQPDGTLLRAFYSPIPEENAYFGASVASDGTFILIGAPGAAGNEGRVYLYDAATGTLIDTFEAGLPHAGDNFGNSVAVLAENFLAGAPGNNPFSTGGAVYRFGAVPPVPANYSGSSKTVNATWVKPGDLLTYTLTLSNSGTIAANYALTDTLDAHVSLISAAGLAGSSTLTATGNLPGSTQLLFQFTVRASQPFSGTVSNTAHLSGDGTMRSFSAPLVTVVNRLWLPLTARH